MTDGPSESLANRVIVGDLELDLVARTVQRHGFILPVADGGFELLVRLVREHPEPASIRSGDAAGRHEDDTSSTAADVQQLREALAGSDRHAEYLSETDGGYRLLAPVVAVPDSRKRWRLPLLVVSVVLGILVFVIGLISARPS